MNGKLQIGWNRNEMAQKVAQDLPDGSYVNLGIGIPELVADHVPEGIEIIYHTENGLLGMGPVPEKGQEDIELINAGKKYITAITGASYFHHADSFTMIRGGHLDISVLGALQISKEGNLANWSTGKPGAIPAVGGAMDLVAGVKNVWVITQHVTKDDHFKLVNDCTFPLTGKGIVDRIYTNLAMINVTEKGLQVRELAPGISFDYLQKRTEPTLIQ
ncbi:MAG: CoA transferase subunit B [Candidatus Marinimicrobia bacterium]|nr:CoA transferase subunit B [Candidatus Neomarinimicrobiota bacterium]